MSKANEAEEGSTFRESKVPAVTPKRYGVSGAWSSGDKSHDGGGNKEELHVGG